MALSKSIPVDRDRARMSVRRRNCGNAAEVVVAEDEGVVVLAEGKEEGEGGGVNVVPLWVRLLRVGVVSVSASVS